MDVLGFSADEINAARAAAAKAGIQARCLTIGSELMRFVVDPRKQNNGVNRNLWVTVLFLPGYQPRDLLREKIDKAEGIELSINDLQACGLLASPFDVTATSRVSSSRPWWQSHCWNCAVDFDKRELQACPQCHGRYCPNCGKCHRDCLAQGSPITLQAMDTKSTLQKRGIQLPGSWKLPLP